MFTFFEWVFCLVSSGSPHVCIRPVWRACGEPNGIELTPSGARLDGPRRVPSRTPPPVRETLVTPTPPTTAEYLGGGHGIALRYATRLRMSTRERGKRGGLVLT